MKLLKSKKPTNILVVKLHPLENDNFCEEILSSKFKTHQYRISKSVDTYGLMAASSAVIIPNSSTGNEAALLKVPIIYLDNFDIKWMPYVKYGLAKIVKNENELHKAVQIALEKPNDFIKGYEQKRNRYLVKCLSGGDGYASKRVFDTVHSLIMKTPS